MFLPLSLFLGVGPFPLALSEYIPKKTIILKGKLSINRFTTTIRWRKRADRELRKRRVEK